MGQLETDIALLKQGQRSLSEAVSELAHSVDRLERLIFGNGGQIGLKTAVCLMQEWVEEIKAERRRREQERWQWAMAKWGWALTISLTVGGWIVALMIR